MENQDNITQAKPAIDTACRVGTFTKRPTATKAEHSLKAGVTA